MRYLSLGWKTGLMVSAVLLMVWGCGPSNLPQGVGGIGEPAVGSVEGFVIYLQDASNASGGMVAFTNEDTGLCYTAMIYTPWETAPYTVPPYDSYPVTRYAYYRAQLPAGKYSIEYSIIYTPASTTTEVNIDSMPSQVTIVPDTTSRLLTIIVEGTTP